MSNDIIDNLARIRAEIATSAEEGGRTASDVTLVAVSKTHDAPHIQHAIDAGHRVFGENRVQEAEGKWPELKERTPDVSLHLIGPLQGNKVKPALDLFDVIETVDRPKLARRLASLMDETGRRPDMFIQVNTGEEPQKAGILPADVDDFVAACRDSLGLPIVGLMCIPPVDEESSLHFALLRDMAHRNGLAGLSMGMSADFGVAVRFGATHVRVGTAIFSTRPPVTPAN
jgi:PLP dependent protein